MTEWIDVKKEMPEQGKEVLIFQVKWGDCYLATYSEKKESWFDDCGDKLESPVSHWMPLPEPPKP